MQKFEVGDIVTWVSQSGGLFKRKTGRVIQAVPAGFPPKIGELAKDLGASSEYGGGMTRKHESYVVLVSPPEGTKQSPKLYWPLAAKLALVPETADPASEAA